MKSNLLLKINFKNVVIILFLCLIMFNGLQLCSGFGSRGTAKLTQPTKEIEKAVSLAIKAQYKSYAEGEVSTEGHIILGTEEKGENVKVYTIASFGAFGFENGIFTIVSGSGSIPTVITLAKNEKGEYSLKDYKEPMDGSYYGSSIKKMFPQNLQDEAFAAQTYSSELTEQKEAQAREYLKSIGRNAEVSERYVERKLPDIDDKASNKLFGELSKYDHFINSCPYWIGTREVVEEGVKYIYEMTQGNTEEGYDLITFRKTKEDGSLIKEKKYKIVGGEPELID